MPRARRYSRALVGSTHLADQKLATAVNNVVKNKPVFYFLTPSNIVLPWLIVELHKELDASGLDVDEQSKQPINMELMLYEKFDSALLTLPTIQKRIYLLTKLEQFKFSITASMLGISEVLVMKHFESAQRHVNEHISAHS